MTLIEVLFNRLRKIESEVHWEVKGHAFTFLIAHQRIGRVWVTVHQEATQVFMEATFAPRSELGRLADCVSTMLLRENGAPGGATLYYSIVNSPEGSELIAVRTFFDYRPDMQEQDQRTYVARFNERYSLIRRSVDEFDGLLKRMLDECGGGEQ